MKLLDCILDLLFPPKCPFCGRVREHGGICPECEKALPWTAENDACWNISSGLRCAAPLWYEDLAREGILRFKFQGASASATALGELLARCAAEHLAGEFDTVTWVPVSRKRLRKRGYDQAELLARAACRRWDIQPVRLLEKVMDNPPQSGIHDAAARRANVLGIYDPVGDIAGKRILLVDDICTTGATLTECVRVLKDAGAESAVCAAVALTREKETSQNVHKQGKN